VEARLKLKARIAREWRYLKGVRRTLKRVESIRADSANLACDDLEAAVDRFRDRQALTFEGKTLTYGEMDALANRYAHWAKAQGITRGQTVALFMPNRIEYLPIWYGLSKVGVVCALINNQLHGAGLVHCLDISNALHCLVDAETGPALMAVRDQLARHVHVWNHAPPAAGQRDLGNALKSSLTLRPDRVDSRGLLRAKDVALLIYTSGTTGLPKAARVTHMRVQLYMRGFAGSTDGRSSDRLYNALPLYHATGGLCAMGAVLLNGGSVVLKRRFSASHFWSDIYEERCTLFVYIGELGRYLVNQAPQPHERDHQLRLAFGNGLAADVWRQFNDRFGIPEVLEFYGATEGNVSTFNFHGPVGACGRLPKYLRKRFNFRLALFNDEIQAPWRNAAGRCVEAPIGEIGECLGRIGADARSNYTGYADKAASEKKVLHDVFAPGDAWFRTGDLMRMDADGWLYFVDRVGETFRRKGENVATSEVAACLRKVQGVLEATVYGVKVAQEEGRTGMAALVVDDSFDLANLAKAVEEDLPAYAHPMFVRLLPRLATTGTFKVRKQDLVAESFEPVRGRGPIFYKSPKGYVKLTKATFDKLAAGTLRL
jgi:fatty-acyl-CoA synthase